MFERALTPQDIHERYKVLNGAIYGLASHGKFLGAFKPGNRSRQVKGLYLAGGAAHPGPGMPMVMMSGWIAADALDQDQPQHVRARFMIAWRRFRKDGRPVSTAWRGNGGSARRSPLWYAAFVTHLHACAMRRDFHAVRLAKAAPSAPSRRHARG